MLLMSSPSLQTSVRSVLSLRNFSLLRPWKVVAVSSCLVPPSLPYKSLPFEQINAIVRLLQLPLLRRLIVVSFREFSSMKAPELLLPHRAYGVTYWRAILLSGVVCLRHTEQPGSRGSAGGAPRKKGSEPGAGGRGAGEPSRQGTRLRLRLTAQGKMARVK